jgi:hypothetical protein
MQIRRKTTDRVLNNQNEICADKFQHQLNCFHLQQLNKKKSPRSLQTALLLLLGEIKTAVTT